MNDTTPRRFGFAWLVWLIVGLAAGAGVIIAYYQGLMNPVLHRLGYHSLMVDTRTNALDSPEGTTGIPGHEGHGGMKMEKAEPAKIEGYTVVTITPERQQLIGVRTGKVQKGKLLMSIRAVGIVEPDQMRLARQHTRISGWVTKVYVDFVGKSVKEGDPLLDIYSPDLLATQNEYLIAYNAWETGGKTKQQWRIVESTRQRLELWKVSKEDIKKLEKTKKARDTLTLRAEITGTVLQRNVLKGSQVDPTTELYRIADLSKLWVQARIYEYELPHVELRKPVEIRFLFQPDVVVASRVEFVEPFLQETTRTVKVRVPIDNPKNLYKPGMYADLKIIHDMGTGLLVPESALLRTGERDLAFRVLGGGRFEPVEVKVGGRFEDRYEVLAGLSEGDKIVTSATFLIDAESRLKAAVSGMGGHQHGSKNEQKKAPEPKKVDHSEHSGHKH
jgi:Cu(I)/Ag(I) efflux system membrane fusion protein